MTDMKMPSGTRVPNNQGRSLHGPGPVMVEHNNMKFLITDRPTDATLPRYIEVIAFPVVKRSFRRSQTHRMMRFLSGSQEIRRSPCCESVRTDVQRGFIEEARNRRFGKLS